MDPRKMDDYERRERRQDLETPGAAPGASWPATRRVQVRRPGEHGGALRGHDGWPRARGRVPRQLRHGRGSSAQPRPRGHRRVRHGRGESRTSAASTASPARSSRARPRRCSSASGRRSSQAKYMLRGDHRRRADRLFENWGRTVERGLEDLRLHARRRSGRAAVLQNNHVAGAAGEPQRRRRRLGSSSCAEAPLHQGLVPRPLPPRQDYQDSMRSRPSTRARAPPNRARHVFGRRGHARRRVARRPAAIADPRRRRASRSAHRPQARRHRAARRDH